MRIWECDMCKKRLHDGEVVPLMEFDLCSDCVDRVKRFIRDGLEPVKVTNEPRKTCNTCVHFMRAKSRCLKKNVPIHENDRDACLGWSDIKHCDNCKWSVAGRECYKERVYCGKTGYCDQWES